MNFFKTFSITTNLVLALLLLVSCDSLKKSSKKSSTKKSTYLVETYTEKFRPQFHFSPPEKWMNDPNGLVYHQGVYHLFYQNYPDDIVWGPMHWGHAVSKDLVHWEHKPIALYPDKHGLIFSGSAVVDSENTSGFGSKDNPPLVAIFTYHLMEGEKAGRTDFQTQGIAYSLDNGDSWTKYEGNPVIGNDGIKDFRDPKVFWHQETKQWIMVLVAGDHAKFYSSPNLKDWTLLSVFGKDQGAHGGVWECPDLFKLKAEGSDEEKWVLIISINPGAPNGGSGTQYFIGDFDGTEFKSAQQDIKWIDHGTDNYAGVTYNNVPNGDRIFIGWMSNWNYARNTPTEVWRSAMTLPRKLTLHHKNDDFFLKNYPLKNFDALHEDVKSDEGIVDIAYKQIKNECLIGTDIRFDYLMSEDLRIRLSSKETNDNVTLFLDAEKRSISFDRTKSGIVDFEDRFASSIHYLDYTPKKEVSEVRLIIDASSIEIFIDKGRYVITEQLFPQACYDEMLIQVSQLSVDDKNKPINRADINNFKMSRVKSIWNEK